MKMSLLSGAFLVAGTAIGGGMLALPVLTAEGGFIPAVVLYFFCWIFMAGTGILLMEVFLWNQEEVNIVSMARMTLGNWGRAAAWLLYLFFFYSLTVAYISGGGDLVAETVRHEKWSPLIFVLAFAPFVIVGPQVADKLNLILMGGLILSFLFFAFMMLGYFSFSGLKNMHWPAAFLAMPVIFTSFGFQGIVPTLTNYLGRDPKKTRLAIWIGTFIPFLIYIFWEGLILGVVPLAGLEQASRIGKTAVYPLKNIVAHPSLFLVGEFFAFFAIVTSFLGVTLGLFDFLADGLKIKKTPMGRLLIALLVFGPPLVFASFNPCLFLNALRYAGGFGSALLLGLLPVLMAWSGRYRKRFASQYSLGGGKPVLILMILFIFFELFMMGIKFVE